MVRTRDIVVVAPNFKKRLSGVTSTIIQLVPHQSRMGLGIAAFGPGLPASLPRLSYWQTLGLVRRPARAEWRIWHARRNTEMIGGLVLRHLMRARLKLVFTSASQREHQPLTRWLIRRMDAVVATSRKTAAYLQVPNTVIMHGIDTERFRPLEDKRVAKQSLGLDPDAHVVGCFGRIRHQKGTDLFVDALIRLLPENPDWVAVIAGRTTAEHVAFEKDLRQRIERAGLSDRIRFVGEHTDIERWYQVLSLYIAPQRWEGFGLTPLEAMACGVPVVAADVGAFSEMVTDGAGTVVAKDDLDALQAAAGQYMRDEQKCTAAGQVAYRLIHRSFRLQREAEQLISLYDQLLGASASTARGSTPALTALADS